MKKVLVIIFLLLIFFSNISFAFDNTQNAYKLVNFDPDDYLKNKTKQLIIYNFCFKKISLSSNLFSEKKIEINSKKNDGHWSLINNDQLLKIYNTDSEEFSLDLNFTKKKQKDELYYRSYLMTIGQNPVFIKFTEDIISENGDDKDNIFQLGLNPLKIDLLDNRVLTEVEFVMSGVKNNISNTELTSWSTNTSQKPIAIIGRNEVNNGLQKRDYYAFYLTSTVMEVDEINWSGITPIGDISGLNSIFKKNYIDEEKLLKRKLGFYFKEEEIDLIYNFTDIDKKLAVILAIKDNDYDYNLDIGARIFSNENLYLSSKLTDQVIPDLNTLFFGFSDRVVWFNNIAINIDIYPVIYDFDNEEMIEKNYCSFGIDWKNKRWDIWYRLNGLDKIEGKELGLGCKFAEKYSLETSYSQVRSGEKKIAIGFIWHIN